MRSTIIGINIAVTAQTSIIRVDGTDRVALRMLIYIYVYIYIYIYWITYTSALYEWNAERANAPKLSYDYTQVIRGADMTWFAWSGRYLRDEMSSRTCIRGGKFEMLSEDRCTLEMPD